MNMPIALVLLVALPILSAGSAAAASSRLPTGWPLAVLRVSSGFGWRLDPISRRPAIHTGIDLAAPLGTPIRATAAGRVVFVGRQQGYGRVVVVAHDRRVSSLYAHLLRPSVRIGQLVARGALLGLVGSSGRATGPHLHYEVRIAGIPTDPWPLLAVRAREVPARPPGRSIPTAAWPAAFRPAGRSG